MLRSIITATLFTGLVTVASAQTIPSPSNPTPDFPIATDGTPLPSAVTGTPSAVASRSDALPSFNGFFAASQTTYNR